MPCSEAWVWAFNLHEYPTICAFCFTEKNPQQLLTCSGCKLHRYCGAKCQTADWKKEHKRECALLKDVIAQTTTSTPVHAYALQFFGYFNHAVSAADLLVAKVAHKIKLNKMEKVYGSGKMSPQEILKSLTNPFPSDDLRTTLRNLTEQERPPVQQRPGALIASVLGIPLNKVTEYYNIATHNSFHIRMGPHDDLRAAGSIVYRHALRRTMRPVCADVNVLMNNPGRSLTLYAAEIIQDYTGFHDLRYKYWPARDEYSWWITERRGIFEDFHGFPCTCRKCSKEYAAEVNPLKCATVGCMERIPSDQRALQPCEQCGAINADRLEKFQQFMEKYEADRLIKENSVSALGAKDVLLKELDAAELVHLDAYVRYLLGWAFVPLYVAQGRYEEGWKLMQELVMSVRRWVKDGRERINNRQGNPFDLYMVHIASNVYPTFHDTRAALLSSAAACPLICLRTILEKERTKKGAITKREKSRLISVFTKACTTSLGYFTEARDIFLRFSGPDSAATKHCDASMSELHFVIDHGPIEDRLVNYRYQIFYENSN